jgi:hypothetical protein
MNKGMINKEGNYNKARICSPYPPCQGLASIVVTRRTGYSEGPNFSPNYAGWRTRLSLTINREIANAIFEGDRNARGERQFAAGCGLAESNLHLFEPVQLLL